MGEAVFSRLGEGGETFGIIISRFTYHGEMTFDDRGGMASPRGSVVGALRFPPHVLATLHGTDSDKEGLG